MDSNRDGREAGSSRKRTASAMLLQEAAYRDGKIAVALASASNDVGLTESGSTLLLDRPCQNPCRVIVLSLTTAGCYAVTGTLLLQKSIGLYHIRDTDVQKPYARMGTLTWALCRQAANS
eukprot:359068-Chlamydomonas_euryale.AAC.2